MDHGAQTPRPAKTERLEARVTAQQKKLIQRAAALDGLSLTDFIVSSAQRAARKTIRTHREIVLSARDSQAFAEAFLNPGQPNAELRDAFARLDAEVRSEF